MGEISVERSEQKTIIRVVGKFCFGLHARFRDAYRRDLLERGGNIRFVVDLSRTDFIDSSALGMLIMLREEAGTDGDRVELTRVHPGIRRVLEEANFHRLFNIT